MGARAMGIGPIYRDGPLLDAEFRDPHAPGRTDAGETPAEIRPALRGTRPISCHPLRPGDYDAHSPSGECVP